ncbi:hypothetical protein F5Y09DRAFT_304428 [Xylaria sp. FL1042]|nr:hypothetical protein F5Y09DRAFT_304428 [Xylaria sp. FL1042]
MLRLARLRSILSLGARARFTNSPQPEAIRIQRVKFRRKWPTATSILLTTAATAALGFAYYMIVTRALIILIEEAELELTEEERQELEEEAEEPIFIPFPGFTRLVEPLPYRSTDPEWRAFLRVNRNPELVASIRKSLAEMACRTVANTPQLVEHCGKSATISKYWLDVQYPPKPPPSFVRQGISFGDGNGIRWTTQPVDSLAVFWTRQALWPSALASSLWSFTNALVLRNVTTMARFFGYGSQDHHLANVQQAMEKIQQLKNQPGKPDSVSPPLPSHGRTDEGSTASPLPSVEKRSTESTTTPETLRPRTDIDNAVPNVPSARLYRARTTQGHTSHPWDKFKEKFMQKYQRPHTYPPRGSIRVSGLVEIDTERAILTVDCIGWWDPQTEKYDSGTLILALRSIRPRRQNPLR